MYFLKKLSKKYRHFFWIFPIFLLLCFISADFLFPLRVDTKYAQIILSKEGKPLHTFLSADDKWRIQCALSDCSPLLLKAILEKEDRFFYYHFGVNPLAVFRALGKNLVRGKTVSGASTITMQVVRLLEPKSRTYFHKLLESFRALQLEWHYSKSEILTMYLNLVPYGGNIEGVRAASLLYFGIEPKALSLAQAVVLSVVPNRPTSLALGKKNAAILQARNRWLRRFVRRGVFGQSAVEEALSEPLEAFRRASPKKAPHFSVWLNAHRPNRAVLHTSLEYETQARVAALAAQYLKRTKRFDVNNAAVLVVENASKKIVAYVGNPDFADSRHAGQVNGVVALRSPGSTLKPFVYGLTFDRGIYTPRSILHDVPSRFENYAPENFDQVFDGKVSLRDALKNSLNLVAVKSLEKVGVPALIELLEKANFRSISRSKHHLGLSLALGGCGVSLWEMAGLYSALATEGAFRPLSYLNGQVAADSLQLVSPEAAFMLTDILSGLDRPDLPARYLAGRKVPKICWKTGTSYGRKDAWSIGFNKKYTVAVWLGNFNGRGARALTGATTATPLLFKIFNTIDYNSRSDWYEMPENLSERLVCQESGLPPSAHCQKLVSDFFIPMVSSVKTCRCQKLVFLSEDEHHTYCPHCLPSSGYKKAYFPNYAAEILAFHKKNRLPLRLPPPHYAHCSKVALGDASPRILSPIDGREYLIEGTETELALQCQIANDADEVYWYINNKFFAKSAASKPLFFVPPEGHVKISCSDNRGRNTDSHIIVKKI